MHGVPPGWDQMTAQTDIEEKALHWFVVLRDDEAPESAWLEFQDWLGASPTHAAAYDAVERLWVDMDAPASVRRENDSLIRYDIRLDSISANWLIITIITR